ncbi:MAG: recombinase family protein, partial [Anaerolineae bacterium]|nr:recombinase family protein [Anaerolineae bacterium]
MRAAIYWRYSKSEQSIYSEAAQIRACQEFAAARGLAVVEVYGDAGETGKFIKNRANFQALLADALAGRFDVIIVHKLDRFSRNLIDTLLTLDELDKHQVTLASVTESHFDFSTPHGRLLVRLLASFAQWYVENLAQETRKGKEERARQGGWNGGVPFGYTTPKKLRARIEGGDPRADELKAYLDGLTYKREIDAVFEPFDIKGYLLAVELYETGQYSDTDIANILTGKGYRTTGHWGARPFTKDTITPILRNRFYTGQTQYRGQWMPGEHQAAITAERWERLQAARAQRAHRSTTTKRTDRVYPLRKVARCVECGTILRGQGQRQRRYYRDPAHDHGLACTQKTTFPAQPVEDQLGDFLSVFRLPDDWQARVLDLVRERCGNADPDREERTRLEGQLERAKTLFVLGDYDEQAYMRERARISADLARLRPPIAPAMDLSKAAELLEDIEQVWKVANDRERAHLVGTVFENIWIKSGEIVIVEPKPAFYQMMVWCQEGECMSPGQSRPVAPALPTLGIS